MGGQSQEQPVAGTEKSKTSSDTSSKTSGTAAGTSQATQQTTLPDWAQQGIEQNFQNYTGDVGGYRDALGNWQAAPFSADQLAGFDQQRAAAGGAMFQTPLDELLATSRGDYLYGGPGFNAAVDAAYRAGMPGVLSQFGGSGRYENTAGQGALARIFSDAFANQYGSERARQLNASQLLPSLSLLPGQTFENIGQKYQQLQQYGMNYPLESLYPGLFAAGQGVTGLVSPFTGQDTSGATTSDYSSKTKGATSGVSSGTSTPAYFPGSSSPLGSALSGAGMGAMLTPGMPLLGAGLGAGAGLLFS